MADDGVSIEITGLTELKSALEGLKTSVADRCIRKALRAGGLIQKDAVETAAPIRPDLPSGTALPPGALANDVTLTIKRVDVDNTVATVKPGRLTRFVAGLVEYGHRQFLGTRKTGTQVYVKPKKDQVGLGTVQPYPYIRPAFESSVEAATEAVTITLAEEITKAASNPTNFAE